MSNYYDVYISCNSLHELNMKVKEDLSNFIKSNTFGIGGILELSIIERCYKLVARDKFGFERNTTI